jgi:hypothetical protein
MEEQSKEPGYVPAARPKINRSRRVDPVGLIRYWRWPAALTAATLAGAVCLHGTSAARIVPTQRVGGAAAGWSSGSAARPARMVPGNRTVAVTHGVTARLAAQRLVAVDETTGGESGGTGTSSPGGGIRGGFNFYDGEGGGIEFWFDPSTGQLTVAVGVGVGEGGEGVLGTYSPGSAPQPGVYNYVDASFATGTVTTVNVSGEYSWSSGEFAGTIGATVQGRTLTISSDGTSSFTVSTVAEEGAEGFTGSTGIKGVFNFDMSSVLDHIYDALIDLLFGDYELDDDYEDYYDDPGDDGSTSDDDDSYMTDDDSGTNGDDAGSDGGGDGGGGGGGGGGGDDGCGEQSDVVTASLHHALVGVAAGSQAAVQAHKVTPLVEDPCDGDDSGGDDDDER